jgi:hypothetical protein
VIDAQNKKIRCNHDTKTQQTVAKNQLPVVSLKEGKHTLVLSILCFCCAKMDLVGLEKWNIPG